MDHLFEDKIRQHAAEIFGSEPLEGHRERFAGKLSVAGAKKTVPFRRIITYLSAAAIITACIFLARDIFQPDMSADLDSLSEVQTYYAMQLQEKIEAIELQLHQFDEHDKANLLRDIELMQQEVDFAIEESDAKNIELIVMTYSSGLESLQHIQNILSASY